MLRVGAEPGPPECPRPSSEVASASSIDPTVPTNMTISCVMRSDSLENATFRPVPWACSFYPLPLGSPNTTSSLFFHLLEVSCLWRFVKGVPSRPGAGTLSVANLECVTSFYSLRSLFVPHVGFCYILPALLFPPSIRVLLMGLSPLPTHQLGPQARLCPSLSVVLLWATLTNLAKPRGHPLSTHTFPKFPLKCKCRNSA